jgi:putative FmdB family regulatory protein
MPQYTYRCDLCNCQFDAFHSISEKLTVCQCGKEGGLVRIPSLPFRVSIKNEQKPGQVVKEFIKDAKEEIEEYKKEMLKEEYDD